MGYYLKFMLLIITTLGIINAVTFFSGLINPADFYIVNTLVYYFIVLLYVDPANRTRTPLVVLNALVFAGVLVIFGLEVIDTLD